MNKEDNETLKQFLKNYDKLMQDEKYQKYTSIMQFYHIRIKDLKHCLEEKQKIIDDAINLVKHMIKELDKRDMLHPAETELLEILERGKK